MDAIAPSYSMETEEFQVTGHVTHVCYSLVNTVNYFLRRFSVKKTRAFRSCVISRLVKSQVPHLPSLINRPTSGYVAR